MKYSFFFLLLLFFFFSSNCGQQKTLSDSSFTYPEQLESISIHSPVFPVLIGKENNPVLRIELSVKDDQANLKLDALEVSLEGTTRLKDIQKAKLYFTGDSPGFSEEQAFGSSQKARKRIKFSGEQILHKGLNYFWVSLKLSKDADLLHKIGVPRHKRHSGR